VLCRRAAVFLSFRCQLCHFSADSGTSERLKAFLPWANPENAPEGGTQLSGLGTYYTAVFWDFCSTAYLAQCIEEGTIQQTLENI